MTRCCANGIPPDARSHPERRHPPPRFERGAHILTLWLVLSQAGTGRALYDHPRTARYQRCGTTNGRLAAFQRVALNGPGRYVAPARCMSRMYMYVHECTCSVTNGLESVRSAGRHRPGRSRHATKSNSATLALHHSCECWLLPCLRIGFRFSFPPDHAHAGPATPTARARMTIALKTASLRLGAAW